MFRNFKTLGGLGIAAAVAATALASGAAAGGDAERGRYLASIMDCGGCHTGRSFDGVPNPAEYLTGGTLGFELPGLGIFWPPNLTSSPVGLGAWSDEEIAAAIRQGVRPDGRMLAPIMPWQSYAVLTDADAADLVAFLRSLPPSSNRMPDPLPAGEAGPLPYLRVVPPAGAAGN